MEFGGNTFFGTQV